MKPTIEDLSDVCECSTSWINARNCLMIDTVDRGHDQNNTILTSPYESRKKKDVELNDVDLLSTLHDISICVDVGVFMSEHNE